MSSDCIHESIWRDLFHDPALGAGNFLFKSYAAYPDRSQSFLFLEQEWVGAHGQTHQDFSLESLHSAVQTLAYWYVQHQVTAGSVVAVYVGDGFPAFAHFLALNSLGATPALINPNLPWPIVVGYCHLHGFKKLVFDGCTEARAQIPARVEQIDLLNAGFKPTSSQAAAPTLEAWPVERRGQDMVMICHSSGTTGIPKAVVFEHDQFFNGKRERLRGFMSRGDDRLATAMPTTHAAGISYLMTGTLLQMPTLSLAHQSGQVVAEQVAAFGATVLTAFSRTFSSLAQLQLPEGALSRLRRMYSTADTNHATHIRAMLRLAPQAAFIDMLGSSELGMSMFFKTSTREALADTRTVGAPADYADCAILSPQGEVLGDGQPGYIGVRSRTITPGYYKQPHLTANTFLNGYWLTGDIGLRKPDGEYVHLDRTVDVIPLSLGCMAYGLLLEEHLMVLPSVFDAHVVGVPRGPTREEAVVCLVRPQAGLSEVHADAFLQHVLQSYPFAGRAHLPPYTVMVGVLKPGATLPLGATGKLLKRMVREQFWKWHSDFGQGHSEMLDSVCWNVPDHRPVDPHETGTPLMVQLSCERA